MPNNKGGVPMYNENPQYNATIQSQLPQGSPAMYGTQVQKEIAGFGDAMGKLGEKIVDFAVKRQKQEDDNYIMRRENEMRQQLNNLLYNPQDGLTNTKGHKAQGTTMIFDDEADKLTQQFMADVNNPNMQAKFQERISQWLPGYRKNIAVHEGNETFSAKKVDIDTSIQDKIDSALRAPGGQSAIVLYNSLAMNVLDMQDILGMSPEAAAEYVQEKYSAGVLQMAEAMAGGGNTQGLIDLQKATDGKVSAGVQGKLLAMTGKTQAQVKGVDIAKKYLNDPRFKNPDGTLNELALQEFAKENGPEATRTERVLVGGGGGSYVKDSSLNSIIDAAAKKYNVDPLLVAAVARVESYGGNHTIDGNIVTSSMGALGTMQLMPDTAAELGVDPYDKTQNIEGGAKYLKQLLDRFDGDVEKAVSAYNAGPGGDFNNSETRNYRKKVLEEYNNLKAQAQSTPSIDVDAAIDKAWNDYEDKSVPLPEGTNGCAHAANYFVAYFNPWSKGQIEKGGTHMSYVPQLVKDARAADGPGVEDFQEANLKKGDMIVYKAANDPEGMDHVVVYAGDGAGDYRYVGNSSGANNNQGGLVQGSDYRKMGTPSNPLTPQYIIKTSPERNAGAGAHYETRTVSAYNEIEYNAGLKYLKEQIEYSKAQHDVVFNNALNDFLSKVKHVRMPSEVEALSQSYGLTEVDAKKLYNIGLGSRVDLADENQNYADKQRALSIQRQEWEVAENNFYAWLNANPNATPKDMRDKAAEVGVSPRFQHTVNNMAAKGEKSWFQDDQCKFAFNNALSQAGNKNNQKTYAMLRLNQLEDELAAKGEKLTPSKITEEIANMNVEETWYKGSFYEADLKAKLIDSRPGQSPIETGMNTQTDEYGRSYVDIDDSTVEEWTP